MQWPYFVDNKKLVLFSEKDSIILKLKGQNLEKWLQGLRKPKNPNKNIPDNKYKFFIELVNNLGFRVEEKKEKTISVKIR